MQIYACWLDTTRVEWVYDYPSLGDFFFDGMVAKYHLTPPLCTNTGQPNCNSLMKLTQLAVTVEDKSYLAA